MLSALLFARGVPLLTAPHLDDLRAHLAWRLHDVNAGGLQRGHLLGGGALAAAADSAGVAHPAARRSGLAGDEGDHGLRDVLPHEQRRIFLGGAADLAD